MKKGKEHKTSRYNSIITQILNKLINNVNSMGKMLDTSFEYVICNFGKTKFEFNFVHYHPINKLTLHFNNYTWQIKHAQFF